MEKMFKNGDEKGHCTYLGGGPIGGGGSVCVDGRKRKGNDRDMGLRQRL